MMKISEGAEAEIWKISDNVLKKIRLKKEYRLAMIDIKLRRFRNKKEFKILKKLFDSGVRVPEVFDLNDKRSSDKNGLEDTSFTFEFVDGSVLKDVLNERLLKKVFGEIVKMHNQDVVHGDLTTLNAIERDGDVFLIDFGLGEFSHKYEDKAVDLNLFFTCIKNEHPDLFYLKNELVEMYLESANYSEKIISRLEGVELRGRNKKK